MASFPVCLKTNNLFSLEKPGLLQSFPVLSRDTCGQLLDLTPYMVYSYGLFMRPIACQIIGDALFIIGQAGYRTAFTWTVFKKYSYKFPKV